MVILLIPFSYIKAFCKWKFKTKLVTLQKFLKYILAHVAKFYGRLRLIRSVLRASKFSVLKLIEIVILWVYYTIPFGFRLFWHFWASIFNFWIYFVWVRITDEGSVPEMRIWSILFIKSNLKWCIHLSRSLFTYFNYLVSVTAGGPVSPRGHM